MYECMRCDDELIVRELMQTGKDGDKTFNVISECLFCPNCCETYMTGDQMDEFRRKIKEGHEDETSQCEEAEEECPPSRA